MTGNEWVIKLINKIDNKASEIIENVINLIKNFINNTKIGIWLSNNYLLIIIIILTILLIAAYIEGIYNALKQRNKKEK